MQSLFELAHRKGRIKFLRTLPEYMDTWAGELHAQAKTEADTAFIHKMELMALPMLEEKAQAKLEPIADRIIIRTTERALQIAEEIGQSDDEYFITLNSLKESIEEKQRIVQQSNEEKQLAQQHKEKFDKAIIGMLDSGLDVDQICAITKCDREEVESLRHSQH